MYITIYLKGSFIRTHRSLHQARDTRDGPPKKREREKGKKRGTGEMINRLRREYVPIMTEVKVGR